MLLCGFEILWIFFLCGFEILWIFFLLRGEVGGKLKRICDAAYVWKQKTDN
jgi:hypothetical protein